MEERIWVLKTNRTLQIDAHRSLLEPLLDIFEKDLREGHCPDDRIEEIRIAAEEIFINIASYAYPDSEGDVSIEETVQDRRIDLIFSDNGIPYNPLEKVDPDINLELDERDIGGLGIYMVKEIVDQVDYQYKDGENCLHISCGW